MLDDITDPPKSLHESKKVILKSFQAKFMVQTRFGPVLKSQTGFGSVSTLEIYFDIYFDIYWGARFYII